MEKKSGSHLMISSYDALLELLRMPKHGLRHVARVADATTRGSERFVIICMGFGLPPKCIPLAGVCNVPNANTTRREALIVRCQAARGKEGRPFSNSLDLEPGPPKGPLIRSLCQIVRRTSKNNILETLLFSFLRH